MPLQPALLLQLSTVPPNLPGPAWLGKPRPPIVPPPLACPTLFLRCCCSSSYYAKPAALITHPATICTHPGALSTQAATLSTQAATPRTIYMYPRCCCSSTMRSTVSTSASRNSLRTSTCCARRIYICVCECIHLSVYRSACPSVYRKAGLPYLPQLLTGTPPLTTHYTFPY